MRANPTRQGIHIKYEYILQNDDDHLYRLSDDEAACRRLGTFRRKIFFTWLKRVNYFINSSLLLSRCMKKCHWMRRAYVSELASLTSRARDIFDKPIILFPSICIQKTTFSIRKCHSRATVIRSFINYFDEKYRLIEKLRTVGYIATLNYWNKSLPKLLTSKTFTLVRYTAIASRSKVKSNTIFLKLYI